MDHIKNIFRGMVLGIANLIPGVSAGTMAVVLGIYDKIIDSISNLFKDFKSNLKFLLFVGIGAILGIILFSNLLEISLELYPWQTNYFFIGLIVGSFQILYKSTMEHKPKKIYLIYFVLTFSFLIILRFISPPSSSNIIAELNLNNILLLIISGFIASSAMILPGVSGSFILLLIGVYNSIISAISNFNILVLIPFGIGVLLGLITMTKIISYFLRKYVAQTYMAILGLVFGSVFSIFPGFNFELTGLFSVIMLILGFIISYSLCKLNKK